MPTPYLITFQPEDTMAAVPINITDDEIPEGPETIILTLSTPSGTPAYNIGVQPATVTITDNDSKLSFEHDHTAYSG